MAATITHHKTARITETICAGVCQFSDSRTIFSLDQVGRSALSTKVHLSADELIALAKLLNEAVEKLPVQDRPIDLSNLHPVMADAVRPFINGAA
jgi:hypothetical protein